MSDERPAILVVDDEDRVGQAFDLWLGDGYDVDSVTSGEAALAAIHEGIDVVLLDRHMPGMNGDEVLDALRAEGYDCRVAMVTAVDPDFDVVDMPFDHYVSKPVDETELRRVVDQLLVLDEYDDHLAELYAVDRKLAALETEKSDDELADSDRYEELQADHERLQQRADEVIAALEADELADVFRETTD